MSYCELSPEVLIHVEVSGYKTKQPTYCRWGLRFFEKAVCTTQSQWVRGRGVSVTVDKPWLH